MHTQGGFSWWWVYLPIAAFLLLLGLYSRMLGQVWLVEDRQVVVACMEQIPGPQPPETYGSHPPADTKAARFGTTPEPFRPLTALSYRLSAGLSYWIPEILAHRLTNLILVLAIGLLAVGWLAWLTSPSAAWLAGFVFLTHPAQAQSIFMVSARPTLLATAAVLTFLILQRRAIQQLRWSPWNSTMALFVLLAGAGADSTGLLSLPLALAQMALGPTLGRVPIWKSPPLNHDQQQALQRVHRRTLLMLILTLALYVLGRTLTTGWHWPFLAPEDDLTGNPLWGLSGWKRLPVAISLAWLYVKNLLRPAQPWSMAPPLLMDWSSGQVWMGLAVLVLGLALLSGWTCRRHWLTVAGLLALGQYLLISHILIPSRFYAAAFLATPFLVAGTATLAAIIHELTGFSPRRRAVAIGAVLLLIALMSWKIWQDTQRATTLLDLRRAELEAQPLNPVAMFRYGQALYEAGRFEDALYWLENVVDRRPRSIQARRALADLLLVLGRPTAAYRHYQVILQLNPHDQQARQRLEQLAPLSPAPEPLLTPMPTDLDFPQP